MGCRVTAKITRSAKAGGMVAILGFGAFMIARPFVQLADSPQPLDRFPAVYSDFESEYRAARDHTRADSEIEDLGHRPIERVDRAGAGDTLMDLLVKSGVDAAEASNALESLSGLYNPRSLRAGQSVTVTFDRPADGLGQGDFREVRLNADPIREVVTQRTSGHEFQAKATDRPVVKEVAHYSGRIKSSLFESAASAGVPAPVIVGMIHALSYDVDFQRDIQGGDGFDVMFEGYYDPKGKLVRAGDMLYASVNLSGKPIAMYRFENSQGTVEYFNDKGESVKKALLKTPVDGAKITSGFGMRMHPILGFTTMHKGVDFGVPVGTPVMAAGDGMVDIAGFNGSYGNYVRLRHSNNYGTAYAHLSRIAPGIHAGKRVSQGQIVGYVGATGRATGPHLHYEVLIGNAQVNPTSVKIPTGIKLAGRDLDHFRNTRARIETWLAAIPPSETRVAESIPVGNAQPD